MAPLQLVQELLQVEERVRFYVNLHNLLAVHAYLHELKQGAQPFASYFARRSYLAQRYQVGAVALSLDDLQLLLRATPPPHVPPAWAVPCEPRALLVLSRLTRLCAPLTVLRAPLARSLAQAAARHVQAQCSVDEAERCLVLPPQCRDLCPSLDAAQRLLGPLLPSLPRLVPGWTLKVLDEDWSPLLDLHAQPWDLPL